MWRVLHEGVLTTSTFKSALGFDGFRAAVLLGMPRKMVRCGHCHAERVQLWHAYGRHLFLYLFPGASSS